MPPGARDLLRRLFFLLVVRPFLRFVVGTNVTGAEHLPAADPFLLVANHNSHLDTPLLLSLFPVGRLHLIHPVAAADYWLSAPLKRFVAETFFNIAPITRGGAARGGGGEIADPLGRLHEILDAGGSLVLFPEGTRGEPEVLGRFHSGAARLAEAHPDVPVVPVYLKNAGRALPRGTFLFVPFVCEVQIGPSVRLSGTVGEMQAALEEAVRRLANEAQGG